MAAAEMAFAGGCGMEIKLDEIPVSKDVTRNDQILFSESTTRFIVEIEPKNFGAFARLCRDIRFGEIGKVTQESRLMIKDGQNKPVIDADIAQLKETWLKPLRW